MDLPLSCVNNGGTASLIELDHVPQLEEEAPLSACALTALSYWQARPGEVLTVVDPESVSYLARITSLQPESSSCVPFQRLPAAVESPLRIEVYQSLPDGEHFELVLQKLTELGVARVVPFESQHSLTLEESDALREKSHRWPDIIIKTARQCRRSMLPELMPVHTFTAALACASPAELKLMLYGGDGCWTFTESLGSFKPQSVALLIGPEGGFSEEQVAEAQAEGFQLVRLGPRLLRTETAAIVATTMAQSYLGDLA